MSSGVSAAPALTVQPPLSSWRGMASSAPSGQLFGRPIEQWRSSVRRELGLPDDRPIIATGHQPLLWHPGILAKYIAVSVSAGDDLGSANLVVDQHHGAFGRVDLPERRDDGALAVRGVELFQSNVQAVMGRHPAVQPRMPRLDGIAEEFREAVGAIVQSIDQHRGESSAAEQMARAQADMMQRLVNLPHMPNITATALMATSLARSLLQSMVDDPWQCAQAYNAAVTALPEAGVEPLLVRSDFVELPVWRIDDQGHRHRAYDHDVSAALESDSMEAVQRRLMPRALLMTAIMRLAASDLFVHGVGGAVYDAAMERWIFEWLGARPSPAAAVTATLLLPLGVALDSTMNVDAAIAAYRRHWHDPSRLESQPVSADKRSDLDAIEGELPGGTARRAAFIAMHERLNERRARQASGLNALREAIDRARRHRDDLGIATRRDWAWQLYPGHQLAALREAIARPVEAVTAPMAT